MEPALGPFLDEIAAVELRPPQIPYLSNVTGTWITEAEATDPGYWARHLRGTVRFADGLRELLREPDRLLLEVGPGQSLATLARQHPDRGPGHHVVPSARHPKDPQDDQAFLLGALGQAWLAGARVEWAGFHAGERRRRLPLPTYPFERRRYWIEPGAGSIAALNARSAATKTKELADWFYVPYWKPSAVPEHRSHRDAGRPPGSVDTRRALAGVRRRPGDGRRVRRAPAAGRLRGLDGGHRAAFRRPRRRGLRARARPCRGLRRPARGARRRGAVPPPHRALLDGYGGRAGAGAGERRRPGPRLLQLARPRPGPGPAGTRGTALSRGRLLGPAAGHRRRAALPGEGAGPRTLQGDPAGVPARFLPQHRRGIARGRDGAGGAGRIVAGRARGRPAGAARRLPRRLPLGAGL